MADMTETKPKKTPAKKIEIAAGTAPEETAAPKKAAVKHVAATKPVASAKAAPTGPTVTVTQTGSVLGRPEWARQTLVGLGLNKRHRTRVLEDTPSVRGMIERVKHLVRVGDK